MNIDFLRCRIALPDGTVSPVRFIFKSSGGNGSGTAAIWQEDTNPKSARRLLLATGTFTRRTTAAQPHVFTTDDNQQWLVNRLGSTGCGSCKRRASVLGSFTIDQLVSPELSEVN